MTPWLIVLVAGVMETFWAIGLKYSEGFTRPIPSVLTVVGALMSFCLLSLAMRDIPVGTVYAVWIGIGIGIGAAGTTVLAVFLFGELVTMMRIGGIGLIIAGVMTMKLA